MAALEAGRVVQPAQKGPQQHRPLRHQDRHLGLVRHRRRGRQAQRHQDLLRHRPGKPGEGQAE